MSDDKCIGCALGLPLSGDIHYDGLLTIFCTAVRHEHGPDATREHRLGSVADGERSAQSGPQAIPSTGDAKVGSIPTGSANTGREDSTAGTPNKLRTSHENVVGLREAYRVRFGNDDGVVLVCDDWLTLERALARRDELLREWLKDSHPNHNQPLREKTRRELEEKHG